MQWIFNVERGENLNLTKRIKNAISAFRTSFDLNDKEFLESLGISNISKKAISEVTYFTCLKMLSETIGKLPWKFYQNTDKGKIRAEPNKAYQLLTVRPNPIMTPTTFWTTVELNTQHSGNGYVWIRKKFTPAKYGGKLELLDMWIMQSEYTRVYLDDNGVFGDKGKLYYHYTDPKTGEQYVFNKNEVMHFKTWLSFDGIMGQPVKDILKYTVTGSLSSQEFMNRLYEQGLTASMALQYTSDLDDGRVEALQQKYANALTGPKNAGKVIPVPIGFQLMPLKMNLTDAQFFELKKYSALQIAGAFGIKPNHINNYEKSSYANSESQNLSFLVDTMIVRIKAYEEEVNYMLLTPEEQKSDKYYKMNEKVILRADSKTQTENITKLVNNGVYTPNEARDYVDKPHVEGGDIPIVNGNYIPLTQVGKQYKKEGEQNV